MGKVDLKLDSTGDLAITNYDLVIISETERIAQQLWMTLRLFLGEWFLDRNQGVPYFTDVLIKNPDQVALQAIFKAKILAVDDVNRLLEFEMTQNHTTRELTLDFKVDTTYGEVEIDGVL